MLKIPSKVSHISKQQPQQQYGALELAEKRQQFQQGQQQPTAPLLKACAREP